MTYRDWLLGGLGGIPKPHRFDLAPQTYEYLPTLGGRAFGLDRLRWSIPHVRLPPPRLAVHLCRRELAGKKKDQDQKTDQETPGAQDPPPSQQEIRQTSKKLYKQVQYLE